MPVLNMPIAKSAPQTELDDLTQLAISLSRRLTAKAHLDDLAPVIDDVLTEVAAATGIEACKLIEFTESGEVARTYVPEGMTSSPDEQVSQWAHETRLIERLAGGEQVSLSRPDEHSHGPTATPSVPRSGHRSLLGVPASVGGQVTCALVLEGREASRRWSSTVLEHLQFLSEILGAALQRRRQERALRAHVAVIEQLNARLLADIPSLKEEIKNDRDSDGIVGDSAPLRVALDRVAQVSPTNSTVLLLGPTGTGKELFARAVHERSRRHGRPLIGVNCAALPPTLVESELFGHEKGAFTGAIGMRQGRFELADGGTIFLDEIGDLTPEVQVKFLRVLQEGEFERVGSSYTKRVDVRVIAATHHDLEAAVAAGRFRADLYYRLSVYPIRLPSLRERVEDIPRLVWFLINRHQRDFGRRITEVPQSVMTALQQHSWPGNVRELDNVVERAMIASTGQVLQLDGPLKSGRLAPTAESAETLESLQRAHIETVLRRCGWRINGKGNAAERLGIHPNTLRFRLTKLGLQRPTA